MKLFILVSNIFYRIFKEVKIKLKIWFNFLLSQDIIFAVKLSSSLQFNQFSLIIFINNHMVICVDKCLNKRKLALLLK